MHTVTKIGKVALARLFHSTKFRAGKVEFPDQEFDMAQQPDTVEGVEYYLWGIELGFRQVKVKQDQNLRKAIVDFIIGNQRTIGTVLPSHLIVYRCSKQTIWKKQEESYSVYRISEHQTRSLGETLGIHADTAA